MGDALDIHHVFVNGSGQSITVADIAKANDEGRVVRVTKTEVRAVEPDFVVFVHWTDVA